MLLLLPPVLNYWFEFVHWRLVLWLYQVELQSLFSVHKTCFGLSIY